MINKEYYICPICQRKHSQQHMSWHHLLPTVKENEKAEPRIYICVTCHAVIHYCYNNEILRNEYNTLDKILGSKDIINIVNLYKYKKDDVTIKIKKIKQLMKCA